MKCHLMCQCLATTLKVDKFQQCLKLLFIAQGDSQGDTQQDTTFKFVKAHITGERES